MATGCSVVAFRVKRHKDSAESFLVKFLLPASCFLLTIGLLSIHVGAAISSGELGLERMPGRRLLALNATQNLLEDAEALLLIKAAITSDPSNITYWWKRQGRQQILNPCRMRNYTKFHWPGIDCTDRRVTSINLANMSLAGTLSPYLGTLSFLKHLDLSDNLLTGPIPVELTAATNLETLRLGNNRLEGALPTSIGGLSRLMTLTVANNRLGEQIPASIGNLTLLATLNMSANNLSGAIPLDLNLCKRLTAVDLSRNALQGIVPFQGFQNLTVLHLQENQLAGDFVTRLDSFPQLQDVDLSHNKLVGSIPATISSLPLSTQLSLGYNNLSGNIPVAMWELPSLQRLNLSTNNFTGTLPDAVGLLPALRELDVSCNELIGGLPASLAALNTLVVLNASVNSFNGNLPRLAGLKNLGVLDLSYNRLSGPILADFVDFSSLQYLNVSYNNLRGLVPIFEEHDDVNSWSFLHNRVCGPMVNKSCGRSKSDSEAMEAKIIQIGVGSAVAVVVIFVVIYICCIKCVKKKKTVALGKFSETVSTELVLHLTPDDILRATQNFNQRNHIGDGNMSTVYSGVLPDGTQVAVKRLDILMGEINANAEKTTADAFETLSHVRHWSLVRLLGYCCSPDMKALVMEFVPNGTLANLMYPAPNTEFVREFNWNHRFHTAICVAEGLKYLHHECSTSTVHGNLKPSNILFNTFMEGRIADFGIARVLATQGLGSGATPAAANGYMPPEAATQGCTIKGDVYSFGIILLEMISGRSPNSLEAGRTLPQWIRDTLSNSKALHNIVDPTLRSELEFQQQKIAMVLGVALLCTRENVQERPYITEVLKMLNHIKSRPEDGQGSMRLKNSASTRQRNEEIRQEVPGIEITPSPPITPGAAPPHSLPLQGLHTNPSLSNWTPSPENR